MHHPLRAGVFVLGLVAAMALIVPAGTGPVLGAADTTPPVVGTPVAAMATGSTVSARSVPLRVSWTAADPGGTGVMRNRLQLSVDGGSWTGVALASPTAHAVTVRLAPPHETRFRVRAEDRAGNASAWRYGIPFRVRRLAETGAGVVRTPGWSLVAARGFLGHRALRARSEGSAVTFAFHGSQVAWFGRRSPAGGAAWVELDGVYRTTVGTYGSSTADRRVLYVAAWPSPGDHTLTIRVAGTAGHPDVIVDGFVVVDPPAADPVLVGAGDVAWCGSPADNRTADLLDAIAGRVFVAGDTAYPTGSAAQFRDCYGPSWGRWKARTSPAIGNHEYGTPGGRAYWDYFGARAGARGKGWYAYDLGAWRVYTLNSNCSVVGCSAGSEQERWLRADLAANPRACVAAVWHHPLFSSGEHGNNPAVRPLWEALEDAGADLVLAGHDHDYERFAPQDARGNATADGIRQFVVGTGGAALRPFGAVRENSDVREAGTHGVLRLTLRAGAFDWRFVPVAGATFRDAGSAGCH